MRNSAIQGYNEKPLYPSSDEALKAYSVVDNRMAPDWFTKKEEAEWHPEDKME